MRRVPANGGRFYYRAESPMFQIEDAARLGSLSPDRKFPFLTPEKMCCDDFHPLGAHQQAALCVLSSICSHMPLEIRECRSRKHGRVEREGQRQKRAPDQTRSAISFAIYVAPIRYWQLLRFTLLRTHSPTSTRGPRFVPTWSVREHSTTRWSGRGSPGASFRGADREADDRILERGSPSITLRA
jgi:hypothetical protein